MEEIILSSGAVLRMQRPSFELSSKLCNKIFALRSSIKGEITEESIMSEILSNEKIEDIIYKCFSYFTYNNIRLSKELFNDLELSEKLMGDFYEIKGKAIVFIQKPFLAGLLSKLNQKSTTAISNQKSK